MTWRKKTDAPEKLRLLCVTLFQKPLFSAEVFVSYFKGLPLGEEIRECCHGTRKNDALIPQSIVCRIASGM